MFSGNEWVILMLFALVLTVPVLIVAAFAVRKHRNETAEAPNAPSSNLGVVQLGPPPGWFPDPSGRNEQRYWDGAAWTDAVISKGVPSTDSP